MKWLNFGGGHHITREDYDIDLLCQSIKYMRDKYDLEIYLEPGEAVALNAGYLVSQVMDVVNNGIDIAILAPPPPAICQTCWKCPTVLPSSAAASLMRSRIPTASGAPPVGRGYNRGLFL